MRTCHCCIQPEATRTTSASSGAQESKRLKSKFINQFTMSLPNRSVWGYGDYGTHQPPSATALLQGVWAQVMLATTLATGGFFCRVCEYAVLFLTTTTAFLLPCLNLVYMLCTVRPCGKESSSVHKACTMMLMHSPMQALPAFTGTDVGGEGLYGLYILGVY